MEIARRAALAAYVTRDGSEIRECVAPDPTRPPRRRSLAEATVPAGGSTLAGAPLVVVCSCVPPYSHEDTVLVD